MTEQEWLECADPKAMEKLLDGKASERKWRLFDCSCVRTQWTHLKRRTSRWAVEAAEAFADGLLREADLEAALKLATELNDPFNSWVPGSLLTAA